MGKINRYTVISYYSCFCRDAYEKFPFGRDWSLVGEYNECYAAICQYLMRRYKTIEQFYDPMCLQWRPTKEVFFEYGDLSCEINGEILMIEKA